MMKYRSIPRDIVVVMAITIIMVFLLFIVPANWLPVRLLALPLVLVLPGYALTAALFPQREFPISQRLVFSIALSLVTAVLGGLLINLTPFGLQTDSWAVILGGVTLCACAVTLIRRRGQSIPASGWSRATYFHLRISQWFLLGLSALLICGAFAVSIIGAEHQPSPGFTQLWMLPANGANVHNSVQLGVNNMETTPMQYHLVLNVNGKKVVEWPNFTLSPNQKWQTSFSLSQTGTTGKEKVEADLYRLDAPTSIYRHVVLWLSA